MDYKLDKHIVKVLLPYKLNEAFDYYTEQIVPVGSFVRVEFGRKKLIGVVWGHKSTTEHKNPKKVEEILDRDPITPKMIEFVNRMAEYTLAPLGLVLKMVMPEVDAIARPASISLYDLCQMPDRMTPPRQKVKELLEKHPLQSVDEIRDKTGVGLTPIKWMIENKMLALKGHRPGTHIFMAPDLSESADVVLNEEQQFAANHLKNCVKSEEYSTILLDGVTGSGKTEVYYEAIIECLRMKKQVLVMLPEISLSSQWLGRFERRFGVEPAIWHSNLSTGDRKKTWDAVAEGKCPILVGARSALMLPYKNLGLIIVDEEHDGSYKQEEQVIYNARDMAVLRAMSEKIPCVLASATPSIETIVNAESGKYDYLEIKARYGEAVMPDVHLIDMRQAKQNKEVSSSKYLSAQLKSAISRNISQKYQILLFMNRRGFSPVMLCSECGDRVNCHNCSTSLVLHSREKILRCHHCGFQTRYINKCSSCGVDDSLIPCGPGVERIAEEVEHEFPSAKIEVVTSDTMTNPNKMFGIIRAIENNEVDIIIGTQMISKGYHFPKLTMVGVIDADVTLGGGDLRAAEKTYQLLHQVSGRSGREAVKGEVWLQTYAPENPIIQSIAKQDRDSFVSYEVEQRKILGFPPFGRLVSIVISGPEIHELETYCRGLRNLWPRGIAEVEVMGPVPAPISFLRGRHRRRFLLKSPRNYPLQRMVSEWIAKAPIKHNIKLHIDVDPYSFM